MREIFNQDALIRLGRRIFRNWPVAFPVPWSPPLHPLPPRLASSAVPPSNGHSASRAIDRGQRTHECAGQVWTTCGEPVYAVLTAVVQFVTLLIKELPCREGCLARTASRAPTRGRFALFRSKSALRTVVHCASQIQSRNCERMGAPVMNVVGFNGGHAAATGKANENVIETLERLLGEAKAGRLQHIAAVFSDGINPPTDLYAGSGEVAHVIAIIGGMELCKAQLVHQMVGDDH